MQELRFKSTIHLRYEPKLRSLASRCAEAARGLGLEARTLSYKETALRFLYRNGDPIFECYGWQELLDELERLGATIPPEYRASRENDTAE